MRVWWVGLNLEVVHCCCHRACCQEHLVIYIDCRSKHMILDSRAPSRMLSVAHLLTAENEVLVKLGLRRHRSCGLSWLLVWIKESLPLLWDLLLMSSKVTNRCTLLIEHLVPMKHDVSDASIAFSPTICTHLKVAPTIRLYFLLSTSLSSWVQATWHSCLVQGCGRREHHLRDINNILLRVHCESTLVKANRCPMERWRLL